MCYKSSFIEVEKAWLAHAGPTVCNLAGCIGMLCYIRVIEEKSACMSVFAG